MQDFYLLFKEIGGGCIVEGEVAKAVMTWEDWIFVESQRRYALYPVLP